MSSEPPSPAPDGDRRQFERIDASEFVERDGPAATSHTTAEGAPAATETDMGRQSRLGTLKQMALSTEPTTPLDEIESPWDPDLGGVARIFRGVQKATGYDGIPAVFDVTIGFMEWAWSFQLEEPGRDRDDETGEQSDPITAQATADEP